VGQRPWGYTIYRIIFTLVAYFENGTAWIKLGQFSQSVVEDFSGLFGLLTMEVDYLGFNEI